MKRRGLFILAAVNLVLFVATCAFWVRSYLRTDHFAYRPRPRWLYEFASGNGQICLLKERGPAADTADSPSVNVVEDGSAPLIYVWGSVGYADLDMNPLPGEPRSTSAEYVAVSYLSICVASAMPSALYVGLRIRRKRKLRQASVQRRCVRCGYDLRATPERCPECGVATEKVAG